MKPIGPADQALKCAPVQRLPDQDLLDLVQRQTFRYFWDFAHPVSGLARDRNTMACDASDDLVAVGGSGFGVMAIIVAVQRGWIAREEAVYHLGVMVRFLERASCYHGIFPHFLNGRTGATIPFDRKDDGGDIVETAFLFQGLLTARQYFNRPTPEERNLSRRIDRLWHEAEWDWHTRDGRHVLTWHWSPQHGWSRDHEIRGWNECLITYVLAASSPRHAIGADVHHRGWAEGRHFLNRRCYYGIDLPLGPDYGGPLYFCHYSFMGLDPRGLSDEFANYWDQNVRHSLIHYEHCKRNPNNFLGYGPDCWGLSSSDSPGGYVVHTPTNDLGVIAPSAALSSFPYTPDLSMWALRYFLDGLGDRLWGPCGFIDAFSESMNWFSNSYVAIDQGPIIVMIENARSGLIWQLFMSCPEIRDGLKKLGFGSPHLD